MGYDTGHMYTKINENMFHIHPCDRPCLVNCEECAFLKKKESDHM